MAGAITRGTTFTLGQQDVTAAQFMVLLTSATIANLDRANIDVTAATVATRSSTSPSNPQASEVWQESTSGKCTSYVSGKFEPSYSSIANFTLISGSTQATAGDVLMPNGSLFFLNGGLEVGRITSPNRFRGVAIGTTLPGHGGKMVVRGPALVKATGAIAPGQAVRASTSVSGKCEAQAALGSGFGTEAFGTAISTATGGFVWATIRR